MSYYVPIFSKIVDSSLWTEPDFVVKIFITMLAKKDRDNVCRGSAFNIAKWANKTEAETIEALKVLAAPDTKRLEPQPFEGRRIEKVEEGWLVLNGEFYQKLMSQANRREYKSEKQREYRQPSVNGETTVATGNTLPAGVDARAFSAAVVSHDPLVTSPPPTKPKNAAKQTDEEFLEALRTNPAYRHLDIMVEHGKAMTWCSVNRRTCTQKFFVNWINREKPMTAVKKDVVGGRF